MSTSYRRAYPTPVVGLEAENKKIKKIYKLMVADDYTKNIDEIGKLINTHVLSMNVPNQSFDLMEYAIKKKCVHLIRLFLTHLNPLSTKPYLGLMLACSIPINTIREALKCVNIHTLTVMVIHLFFTH